MRPDLVAISLILMISSCGEVKEGSNPMVDVDELAILYEQTFETPEDHQDMIIRDQRIRVTSDALQGAWFYTQLNTGAEGKLYRQRLSHLQLSADGTAIVQKTYALKTPESYEDAWEKPELLNALKPADFQSYFTDGCELIWRAKAPDAWAGYVDPKTCVVSSKRRNKDIRIESEVYLSKDIYRTNERGYEMDMTFLWGTKPGEYIELYPVR